MTTQEFEKLKQETANREKEISRNEGALASLMEQLLQKFGVKTLKEATAMLSILEADSEKYNKELADLFILIENILRENQ